MGTNAQRFNLPCVDEQRLGGLSEVDRHEVYACGKYSRSQIAHFECMVAQSGMRAVGKGALNNVRTHFASRKNHALRLLESHTCERTCAYLLELDPDVLGYYVQVPCHRVVRVNENGAQHVSHATLDFLVFRRNGLELVECKDEEWLRRQDDDGEWTCGADGWTNRPYKRWADEHGIAFRIFALTKPFAIHLRTLEAMYATLDLPLTKEELRIAERAIALLAKKPYSIEEMGEALPGFNERVTLSLLACHKCYGLVRSTTVELPHHFYLYSDREQARIADALVFDALRATTQQPISLDSITTASATDYKAGLSRLERLERIEAGLEKSTVRMRQLAADVRKALSEGKPALLACLTQHARSGNRESRLDPIQRECIVLVMRSLWNSGKTRTRKNLWFALEKECQRHQVATPSRDTLNRYLRQQDPTRRALATGGMRAYQAARPISDPTVRSGKALGYGHTLHIDSSQCDTRCLTQFEAVLYDNKPWFYIGVDEATDMPMARSIYFGRACTNGVALLLRDFVRRHGFLPFVIVLDRGSENDSKWLKAFCLENGITLLQVPTGGSRFNGQAENAIKRVNESVPHDLPGSTEPDKQGRKVDGKFKSEKTARLAFATLSRAFDDYIVNDMPNTPCDNDRTPNERRDEAMSRYGVMGRPQAMDDDFLFKTSVNITFTGKATEKRGIKTNDGIFTSQDLSVRLRTFHPEEVRRDCENGSLLFVKIAGTCVKAFKNNILTIASLTPEERVFLLLSSPYARRSRRRRALEVDRQRYERHQKAIAEADAMAAKPLGNTDQQPEAPHNDEPREDTDSQPAWGNYEPLPEE